MTNQENNIPIKGYSTFDPLKHCWIGSGFEAEWFRDLPIFKNKKIMDPLKRIAEETEEDYQKLDDLLKSLGVKTHRSFADQKKFGSLKNIYRPPVCPRDDFAVIGEKIYASMISNRTGVPGYENILKQIKKENVHLQLSGGDINTAIICRVGKDLYWDVSKKSSPEMVEKYRAMWTEEGFRVHLSNRGYHSDGLFCVVRPGCIVTLLDVQDYNTQFPGWDVLYLPNQSWKAVDPFVKMKDKVGGRWWLKGEEHNDHLIEFINAWLDDWVGYVEETVFDVNMLSINESCIICNNHNKEVFKYFKKHKVEPIVFNFRHRYFWDGGVHCITQDLYREGTMVDYFE